MSDNSNTEYGHWFIGALYEAGWRAPCDAQHTHIKKLIADHIDPLTAAREERDRWEAHAERLSERLKVIRTCNKGVDSVTDGLLVDHEQMMKGGE